MLAPHARLKERPRLSCPFSLWIATQVSCRLQHFWSPLSIDERFWIAVLCQDEEDGEDADAPMVDEDMSTGGPDDGDTLTSGETVDGSQIVNDKFIEMLREASFFFFLFKWDTFANVLGCDETRCWCAKKETDIRETAKSETDSLQKNQLLLLFSYSTLRVHFFLFLTSHWRSSDTLLKGGVWGQPSAYILFISYRYTILLNRMLA